MTTAILGKRPCRRTLCRLAATVTGLGLVVLPLGVTGAQSPATCPGADTVGLSGQEASEAVLCLLTAARRDAGALAPRTEAALGRAAARHAADLVRTGRFTSAGSDGSTPASRARAAGYRGTVDELIAAGEGDLGTPRASVRRWQADPAQRTLLLRPAVRDAGIAVLTTADGGTLTTLVLGRPAASSTVVRPVVGGSVAARVLSGTVLVAPPGAPLSAAKRITGTAEVRVGSTLDTTRGRIILTSAQDASGRTQRAAFDSGAFVVRQTRTRGGPVTVLRLAGALTGCAASPRGVGATTAAAKKKTKKKTRRLWGNGKGKYRTEGTYAAATVRGTVWLTEDRCTGTFIRVRSGTVRVRPRGSKRTITVRAGRSVLIRRR